MRRAWSLLSLLSLAACVPATAGNQGGESSAEANLGYAYSDQTRVARFSLTAEVPDNESVFKYECKNQDAAPCLVTIKLRVTTPDLMSHAADLPDGQPILLRWAAQIYNGSQLRDCDSWFACAVSDPKLTWVVDDLGLLGTAEPYEVYGRHEFVSIRRPVELSAEALPSIEGELRIETAKAPSSR